MTGSVLPNKVDPICQRCGKGIATDDVRLSWVEGGERVEESYCMQCFKGRILEFAGPEIEGRVRKEEAELHKLVCPACVRRIRKRGGG